MTRARESVREQPLLQRKDCTSRDSTFDAEACMLVPDHCIFKLLQKLP